MRKRALRPTHHCPRQVERDRSAHKERSETRELRDRYEQLTPREREVMALVVTGMLNKQVAGELATTERTIKFHRANIMQKMKAESLADLVRMAEKIPPSSQPQAQKGT